MNHENKYPNLIPNSERSPEELREMGRKGGIKSGESRRKNKERDRIIRLMAQIIADRPEVKAHLTELAKFFDNNKI